MKIFYYGVFYALFIVTQSTPWDYTQYNNGDTDYYHSNEYHQNQHINNSCNCMILNNCKTIINKISQSRISMEEWLNNNIQLNCGFDENEPLICCPEEQFDITNQEFVSYFGNDKSSVLPQPSIVQTTTDKPWIWSVEYHSDRTPAQVSASRFGNDFIEQTTTSYTNKFNIYPDGDYRANLVEFEDPQTHKNCPPSFSNDFELPKGYNFYKNYGSYKHHWGWKPYEQPHNGFGYPTKRRNKDNPRKPTPRPFNDYSIPPWQRNPNTYNFGVNNDNFNNNRGLLNPPTCGISLNSRIIGGADAGPGQFPWIARIVYRNRTSGKLSYRCAGSLINNRYVITAAHCVTNLIQELEVYLIRLGELESKRTSDCNIDPVNCVVPQDYEVEKLIPHPKYDNPKYANDIALVKLVRPSNAVDVTPLCLPMGKFSKNDRDLTGKTGVIAGWASNTVGLSPRAASLQYVRLPIVDRKQCAKSYAQFSANSRTPIIISSSQLCVQGRPNLDACQGDSGGPLMNEGDDRYILLGLVSFGPRTCGVSNFPGVYTRVSSYINWIKNNIVI